MPFPHQDTLFHFNYRRLPLSVLTYSHLPYTYTSHYTVKQFISRHNLSSIIDTDNPTSVDQSTFCYHILYLLIILTTPPQDTLY